MKRLIDDKEATVARLHELYGRNAFGEVRFDKCIEELYAPIPNWKDKLNPEDTKTWVLCFVSDYSPTCREDTAWVTHCRSGYPFPFTTVPCGIYKYATPIDLNIRYRDEV